jgi:transposase
VLSSEERTTLETRERARSLPLRMVQRARIIRLASEGMRNEDVAREVGVSCPTVHLWRQRFLALRLPGLEKDAPRPGRLPRISARKVRAVVEATLHTTPAGATHWCARTMAKAQGLSQPTIHRIWKQHRLQPHRVETFKVGRGNVGSNSALAPDLKTWHVVLLMVI